MTRENYGRFNHIREVPSAIPFWEESEEALAPKAAKGVKGQIKPGLLESVEKLKERINILVEESIVSKKDSLDEEEIVVAVAKKILKEKIETMEDVKEVLNKFDRSPFVHKDPVLGEKDSVSVEKVFGRMIEFAEKIPGFTNKLQA